VPPSYSSQLMNLQPWSSFDQVLRGGSKHTQKMSVSKVRHGGLNPLGRSSAVPELNELRYQVPHDGQSFVYKSQSRDDFKSKRHGERKRERERER
jgi:hypothetical protein